MQAGTIAGAAFLKEFVKESIPWVHFDIAGLLGELNQIVLTQKEVQPVGVLGLF